MSTPAWAWWAWIRNRRERRALAAWKRKQAVISHHGARKNRPTGGDHE